MPEYSNYLESLDPVVGALSGDEIIGASKDGEAVSLTAQQIADLGGGGGAVDSVNGETGVVVLDATDVGADPAGSASTVNTALNNHISDATAAHAASAISFAPAGSIASTDVQGAIAELDSETTANLGAKVDEETFATLTYGATVTWDLNNRQSPLAKLVATGNFAINMTNVKSGCYGTLLITTNVGSTVILTFDTDFTNKNMIRGATLTTWTFPNDNGAEYTCTFYVDGTTIRWFIGDVATPTVIVPTVKLRRAAVQNVPTADLTNPTSFDTEVIDNNSLWTAGSPTIIDAPAGAGNYTADVSVGVDFAAAAGGNVRRVWVYVNGAAVAGGMLESRQPTGGFNASGSTFVSGTIKVECASGDDITIVPYQDSGSTLTSTVTAYVIFYTR